MWTEYLAADSPNCSPSVLAHGGGRASNWRFLSKQCPCQDKWTSLYTSTAWWYRSSFTFHIWPVFFSVLVLTSSLCRKKAAKQPHCFSEHWLMHFAFQLGVLSQLKSTLRVRNNGRALYTFFVAWICIRCGMWVKKTEILHATKTESGSIMWKLLECRHFLLLEDG
jgi:hypothetical protein